MYNLSDPKYRAKVWENYRMSLIIAGVLILLSLACNAQGCGGLVKDMTIQKVIDKESGKITYWGIGSVSFMDTDDSDITMFLLGKSVLKADTLFHVSITKGAINIPDESNLKGVTLLFSDGE